MPCHQRPTHLITPQEHPPTHTHTEGDRERERDGDRERGREGETETDKQRERERETETERETEREREKERQGWGKIGLRGRGVVGAPFSDPPPLGSRHGALKKVIDGGK